MSMRVDRIIFDVGENAVVPIETERSFYKYRHKRK